MEVTLQTCCGIDVHKSFLVAVIIRTTVELNLFTLKSGFPLLIILFWNSSVGFLTIVVAIYFVTMVATVLGWTPIACAISEFSMPSALMRNIFARCIFRYSAVWDFESLSNSTRSSSVRVILPYFFISSYGYISFKTYNMTMIP